MKTKFPQGSVHGPILFNAYIAPLVQRQHLYAADTQLYVDFPPTDHVDAVIRMEGCIRDVKTWLANNGLILNETKLHAIEVDMKTALRRRRPKEEADMKTALRRRRPEEEAEMKIALRRRRPQEEADLKTALRRRRPEEEAEMKIALRRRRPQEEADMKLRYEDEGHKRKQT